MKEDFIVIFVIICGLIITALSAGWAILKMVAVYKIVFGG